jgi:hypothetical protein
MRRGVGRQEASAWRHPDEDYAMIDAMTRKPLHVSTDGTAGPYIMLPVSQLDEVRQLLDDHGIRYWIEEDVISLNGAPETAVIDFGRGADVDAIQAVLDTAR